MDFDTSPKSNDMVTHQPMPTEGHAPVVSHSPAPAHQPESSAPALAPAPAAAGLAPMPVVQVLSPRGVEYVFLTINLVTAAIGLISVLLALVNGKTDFTVLAFPVSLLVVSVPMFAWLFLRLKRAELRDPSLRADASKRRSTQFIQIISYLAVFFSLIGLVSAGFAKASGVYDGNFVKLCLDVLVIVVIAGGVLAYYWRDEHRS